MATTLTKPPQGNRDSDSRYRSRYANATPVRLVDSHLPPRAVQVRPQHAEVFSVHQRLSEELGRPPSVKELRAQCHGHGLDSIGNDRYRAIIREINLSLEPQRALTLTTNRPFFVCYSQVRDAFTAHLATHHEPPHFGAFLKALKSSGLALNETSLKNIVADIRDNAPEAEKAKWTFSRKRLEVTWPQIATAYEKAAELLKKQKAGRAPAAEEVSHFLKQDKITISARALEFRFSSKPTTLAMTLAPYSDTALATIKTCHKTLRGKLKRDPAIGELTAAVNALSLRKFSPEAIWARVTDYNREHERKKIKLTPTLKSGIYDSDIAVCYKQQHELRQRPPTFKELFEAVKVHLPHAVMRADTFQRRLSSLDHALTHENTLKSKQQLELGSAIQSLKATLKRPPLRGEVLTYLGEHGSPISEDDFSRIFGTFKKRLEPDLRNTYHLAFPHRSASSLIHAYEGLLRTNTTTPSTRDTAHTLGWSEQGVTQMLKTAQFHAARHGHAPILLADSALTADLRSLKNFAETLESPATDQSGDPLKDLSPSLKVFLEDCLGSEWSSGAFYRDPQELSDTRIKIAWLLTLHHHIVGTPFSETHQHTAQMHTIGWALRHELPTLEKNPFSGIPFALMAAVNIERLSPKAEKELLRTMNTSTKNIDPLPMLMRTIDEIAKSTGYDVL